MKLNQGKLQEVAEYENTSVNISSSSLPFFLKNKRNFQTHRKKSIDHLDYNDSSSEYSSDDEDLSNQN
jgi:hypothetical protein